jgi:hypothetical protein
MTQAQLNRAVAQATGETISTIRRHGFSIVELPSAEPLDRPRAPQMVDWDAVDARRMALFAGRQPTKRIAA